MDDESSDDIRTPQLANGVSYPVQLSTLCPIYELLHYPLGLWRDGSPFHPSALIDDLCRKKTMSETYCTQSLDTDLADMANRAVISILLCSHPLAGRTWFLVKASTRTSRLAAANDRRLTPERVWTSQHTDSASPSRFGSPINKWL